MIEGEQSGQRPSTAGCVCFSEDPRCPRLPGPAATVMSADVLSVDAGGTESVAMSPNPGETGDVMIRSRRQDKGGRPVIVDAEAVE